MRESARMIVARLVERASAIGKCSVPKTREALTGWPCRWRDHTGEESDEGAAVTVERQVPTAVPTITTALDRPTVLC